jgi:predicted phage terminase large subunit-like protein
MAEAFEKVLFGDSKRLIINLPPRHSKSEFASYLLPAWFMGNFPDKKIIQATHTAELAVNFGRKVRNLINSEDFQKVFPDVKLQSDSKASGRWATSKGGEYFAVGVGGAIAGKGADLFIIDDPHTEQEAILAAHDPSIYDKVFDWYTSGPRQRLQPDARIVIVMCMTGDTPVLLPNGTEKPLRDIRPGDEVVTYDNGKIATSKINNWRSSGVDSVFTVTTQSGKTVRANARHPFLVERDGERQWVRLRDLKVGDSFVSLKDAPRSHGAAQSPESAKPATPESVTTVKTLTHPIAQSAATECGKAFHASVESQQRQGDFAPAAITGNTPQRKAAKSPVSIASKTATASRLSSMMQWWRNAATSVMCAGSLLRKKTPEPTGTANSALTTATTPAGSVDCCATTATSPLDMAKSQKFLSGPLSTYAVTLDKIVSIEPAGEEEVFDVEVDRTENFIANGIVSHNTRWGRRDLAGRLIQTSTERGDGETEWEVIELPAILPSGKPLWPQFWKIEALEALKAELPAHKWNAQYQQQPTNAEGAILKREWWKRWPASRPPQCEYIIVSADTAFTKNNRSDYTAFTTWGVFEQPNESGSMGQNLILLDAFKERMEFPELKQRALEVYREWEPDTLMIEGKASGLPLIHELRQLGIPVSEFTPTRASGDKIMRANSISDMFASGIIWAPETRWADDVIEECASFPNGAHDDYVDAVIMALMRYRQGGFIRLPSDYEDEPDVQRRADYY